MRVLKVIISIILILFIYNTVFVGGMSLRSIGENSSTVIEQAAETEVGQTIIERVKSWIAELIQLLWDGFTDILDESIVPVVSYMPENDTYTVYMAAA